MELVRFTLLGYVPRGDIPRYAVYRRLGADPYVM
jgi:hypothetical protein